MKKRLAASLVLLFAIFLLGGNLSSSAAPTTYVHGIFSQKPLYVLDGTTGNWLTSTSGNAIASWTEVPLASGNQAFFNAIAEVGSDRFEFRLVSLGSTTVDQIYGKYDIYKNNVKVASAIPGTVYGLNQPVGNYFKFYNSTNTWHVSGYITSRLDY
ncbi:hypothetical protein J2Z69_000478 [Paenibacillus shirakamiensis]|uniref:Uncharacterized protein n=1 Tax=Paenibacillus shirakamiensis TaxID=1265935 RepID=A0ABS4JCL5_9BACL|nr:hypothetical protein [Paenibacillus shirakamiensis]MBP1999459.1 hypothetical protein [Paenibacillus shirakamiensis]